MNANYDKCKEALREIELEYSRIEAELEKALQYHVVDWIAVPGVEIAVPTKRHWPEPDNEPLWVFTNTGIRLSRFVGLSGALQDNVSGFVVGTWHFGAVYAWATLTIPHAPDWINDLIV